MRLGAKALRWRKRDHAWWRVSRGVAKAMPRQVLHGQRSEDISSRSLGSLVDPVNTDERKEVEIAAGNSWRFTSRSEVGYSQASGQENAPGHPETVGGRSNSKRTVMRNNILTPIAQGDLCFVREHQNFGTWNARTIDTLARSFSACKRSCECQPAIQLSRCKHTETSVLIWRMFMTSSMKAAIHVGPNYVSNSEIYKNTKFEDIESVFNITEKLVKEHSEEILNVQWLEYSSPSWMRPVFS